MNLEPEKSSEIQGQFGLLRVLAMLVILALGAITILVVLEVIPRSAFAEMATKTALVAGVCVAAAFVIGLLAKR
jgi:hypothetical protein